MRIVYIAAGAAGSYCGACSHDTGLARGLHARGHYVEFIPLYTPVQSDVDPPGDCPIFYGGISAYLEQHSAIFRHTPDFFDRLFNSRWLLKLVSRFAVSTRPEDLGDMTVSVLRGLEGHQKKELEKLVGHLAQGPRPDVVNLTNTLLSAIAPALSDALGVPVVCTLQGEESFIRRLGEPHRSEAVALIQRHAKSIARFISPSTSYADEMTGFLDVERERIRVVRPGVDLSVYNGRGERPRGTFRIGCLSRIAEEKGTDLLVQAFRLLEAKDPAKAELALAGQARGDGAQLLETIRRDVAEAGMDDRFEFVEAPDLDRKLDFLRRCSVFVLPSRIPERRGTACLEAMAMSVPIVVPDRGAFSEIIALTGGGVLADTDTPRTLAGTLAALRDAPDEVERLGRAAADGVRQHFTMDGMVDATLSLYEEVISSGHA